MRPALQNMANSCRRPAKTLHSPAPGSRGMKEFPRYAYPVQAERFVMTLHNHYGNKRSSRLTCSPSAPRIPGVTGVILAGGKSNRMGSNKALLPCRGGRFIETVYRQLGAIFNEVLLVTNTPEHYAFIPCRKVEDLYPGRGALAGIHAGLFHSTTACIFAVACDMPYLNSDLIRHLAIRGNAGGVLLPESPHGFEPLHAVYGKGCLAAMEISLLRGEQRVVSFFGHCNVNKMNQVEVSRFDPAFDSFRNINTPDEYFQLRIQEAEAQKTVEKSQSGGFRAAL